MRRLALLLAGLTTLAAVAGVAAGASPQATVLPSAKKLARPEPRPVLPARVLDKDGRTVIVRDVSRIVPLNGDIAEVVFTLGLGGNVVGVDTSATYPARKVALLPKIGYQAQLSAEGILSLRPSVVIGSATAGPPAVIEQLRSAGATVVILRENESLSAGPWKLRQVGRALGVPNRGERLARQVARQIAIAREEATRTTSRPRVAFLYVRGTRVQLICGTRGRSNSLITAAGGIDAGAEAGIADCKPITAESLVAAQPDVLLVLAAGLESVGGVDGLVKLPGVAQTPAGRNRRALAYDDQLLLGLGPRTGSVLRRLVRDLHPEFR